MKCASIALSLLLLACSAPVFAQTAAPVPELLNFQGRLVKPDGTPIADGTVSIRFSLWSAQSGGTEKWFQVMNPVLVRNGTFAVLLGNGNPITADIVNGATYLEIKVGTDTPLMPRQQLVSVAYALKANTVADGAITSAKLADGSVTNAKIASGSLTADRLAANALNPLAWLLGGNSGVTSGFLGTTDSNPLEFRANNHRTIRYSYVVSGFSGSINTLGGSENNVVSAGVTGATIAGGGSKDLFFGGSPNSVTANFGTIGGGYGNTASSLAVVAGGITNVASGNAAFIGGGANHTASGAYASVLGGYNNMALGNVSVAAGGESNRALAPYSFAAGLHASAVHNGAFVWADSQGSPGGTDFASTDINQFLIRAGGGVGINTNTPNGSTLAVAGVIESQTGGVKFPDGTIQATAANAATGPRFLRTTIAVASGATVNIPGGYGIIGITGGAGTVILPRANSVLSGTTLILNREQAVGSGGTITVATQGGDQFPNTPSGFSPTLIYNASVPALRFYSDGVANWYQW